MKPGRIASLDYLRGTMALAVMSYHYTVWSGVDVASGSALSKLGIYAVAVFYVLSGLSLTVVYKERINGAADVAGFWVRRIFRIVPLFWVSVLFALLFGYIDSAINGRSFDIGFVRVFLNLTLLFGFINPGAYLTTGAWSIGNEIVFYTMLPAILLLSVKHAHIVAWVFIASMSLGVLFSIALFDSNRTLGEQWTTYINPLNQMFLFMGGVVIGVYFTPGKGRALGIVAAGTALVIFLQFPTDGDRVTLVSGATRLILSACCFALVWAAYVTRLEARGTVDKVMRILGEGCYSIYLLHPLVAVPVVYIAHYAGLSTPAGYAWAAAATFLASWLSFQFIERPMMRVGDRVAKHVHRNVVELVGKSASSVIR